MRQIVQGLVFLFSVGLAAGCTDDGTGVDADLSGTWVGAFPGGGELRLTLTHSGQGVGGVGIISDTEGTRSLFASGSWANAELELTLEHSEGNQEPDPCEAGLRARLETPDVLDGTYTDCDRRVDITLTRDPN